VLVHEEPFPIPALFSWWSLAMSVNHPYGNIVNNVIRGGNLIIIFSYTADVISDLSEHAE